MLDHVILSVGDLPRAIRFYEQALTPLGITDRLDYAGRSGPPGHPDLTGFGHRGRLILWLRQGPAAGPAVRIGFVAESRAAVDAAYAAAMAAGARDDGAPAARNYYDPRYYAANIFDPDGHSLEFVFKSWQHPQG